MLSPPQLHQRDFLDGQVLLFDKPFEWSSFDVVKKVRNAIKIKKVGHAGTLDPLATGLLILCTGKATKQIEAIQGQTKEYTGIIEIGKTTPSYDLETAFDSKNDYSYLTESQVSDARAFFLGEIEQVPPIYSAVKVNGVRAYKEARKNSSIELKKRVVKIDAFEIKKLALPEVHFRIICSKGTYIRSIAHDFGQKLGVGGYLKELRRTKIGEYHVKESFDVQDFCENLKHQRSQIIS